MGEDIRSNCVPIKISSFLFSALGSRWVYIPTLNSIGFFQKLPHYLLQSFLVENKASGDNYIF